MSARRRYGHGARSSPSSSPRLSASEKEEDGDGFGDRSPRPQRRRLQRSHARGGDDDDVYGDGDGDGNGGGNGAAAAEALSFEHLEAVRNITLLTQNEYPLAHLPREKLFKPDDAHAVCFCTYPRPEEAEPNARCDDVSCINFATYIECSPSRCDAGKYCQNQRLQHPERFPRLEAFKTQHKGYGVRARDRIAQGTVIGEYVGEIIDQKELTRRLNTVPRNELNFYYLALEPGVYIDARNKGSFTRFMNHSCEPNCKTEKWTVEGETRIAVLAVRDIAIHEELTFDYQWKALGSKSIKCFCESANCKGVIVSNT
ncbi:hypothetical protein P43SY_008889 [Pythium insidiosum]|uniref:Histone-lysine N-methyltransferase n=1 Tax=Pythium insidiosum TaxID=114742 RepID=A0AAD5LC35_PYTIN|nr:hypothetical protein P43SY_008889 [Pythium insidiosum]